MRVVSSRSDEDIRKQKAKEDLVWPLRELAANLMRVANGAGRPYALAKQMSECLAALKEYADAHQSLPSSHEIYSILNAETVWRENRPWIEERRSDWKEIDPTDTGEDDRREGLSLIRKGALQVVASMLLNQTPQRSAGEHTIYDGVRLIQQANKKRHTVPLATYDEAMSKLKRLDQMEKERRRRKSSKRKPNIQL